jgi:hypothetical protein
VRALRRSCQAHSLRSAVLQLKRPFS